MMVSSTKADYATIRGDQGHHDGGQSMFAARTTLRSPAMVMVLSRMHASLSSARSHGSLSDGSTNLAVGETVILMTPPCLSRLKHPISVQGGAIK